MSKKYSILVIDDEIEILDMLSRFLNRNPNFSHDEKWKWMWENNEICRENEGWNILLCEVMYFIFIELQDFKFFKLFYIFICKLNYSIHLTIKLF